MTDTVRAELEGSQSKRRRTVSENEPQTSKSIQDLYQESDSEHSAEEEECEDDGVIYLSKFFKKKTERGDDIDKGLAEIVNKSLRSATDIKSEDFENLLEKYKVPGNVDNVTPPILNPEFQKGNVKFADNRVFSVQALIGKALTAALNMTNELKLARKEKKVIDSKEFYTRSLDVVTLLTGAFTEATSKRQEAVKFEVDSKYKEVCGNTEAGEFLFTDLQKKLKEAQDEKKILPLNSKTHLGKNFGAKNREPRGRSGVGRSYHKSKCHPYQKNRDFPSSPRKDYHQSDRKGGHRKGKAYYRK